MPVSARLPREHRHGVSRHLVALGMRLHDELVAARHLDLPGRRHALREADIALDLLRQYLFMLWQWRWISEGQFRHASGLTEELGRLIGGWRRHAGGG